MEQLTLFNNTTLPPRYSPSSKRGRNGGRHLSSSPIQRDLWMQETDTERELALFFLDIRNFTPLAEKHQASDIIHIVKKLFSTFQNIIRVYHGRVIETSGDGFYAVFGLDRDVKEGINAAVCAGRAILESLKKMNQQSLERSLGRQIEVGIGIHAGRVATGTLHVGAQDHFVVMGYAVNVAARVQASTKDLNNNFIVSSTVFDALKNPPARSVKERVMLKGVTEPCELYLVGRPYAASA